MFNIQFGGSNSSQIAISRFEIRESFEDLYCRKEELNQLKAFLMDIRYMPENEFTEVIKQVIDKGR